MLPPRPVREAKGTRERADMKYNHQQQSSTMIQYQLKQDKNRKMPQACVKWYATPVERRIVDKECVSHEEQCRTARSSPKHHIKYKNNNEGLCLFHYDTTPRHRTALPENAPQCMPAQAKMAHHRNPAIKLMAEHATKNRLKRCQWLSFTLFCNQEKQKNPIFLVQVLNYV